MVIYKITNLLNSKIYVGKDLHNRSTYFGSGIMIRRAIKKYGKGNFFKEILEECSDIETLNIQEIFWIKHLDAKNPDIGYNLADGGEGSAGFRLSEEACNRIRNSRKGKTASPETRKKMSDAKKGKRWSEAAFNSHKKEKKPEIPKIKKNMSECQKGIRRSQETRRRISEALRKRKGTGVRDPETGKLTYPKA